MRMTLAPEQDLETRDRLVMDHVGLVKSLASRLAHRLPSQVEVSELVSVGVLGLIDAAGRYKASTGVPFDAFARRRIHGAMLDSLRGLDWAPRSLRKMRRNVDGTMAQLRHELKREPVDEEIAKALNVSEPEYMKILDQLRTADLATIRQASATSDGQSTLEVAVDPGEGPLARLERLELREHLAKISRPRSRTPDPASHKKKALADRRGHRRRQSRSRARSQARRLRSLLHSSLIQKKTH